MKALLLKDFYVLRRNSPFYLVLMAAFLIPTLMGNESSFLFGFSCLYCSLIPVNLLGLDEQSGFLQYSVTLPYSKAQIVSEKYVLGLILHLFILAVFGGVTVYLRAKGRLEAEDAVILMSFLVIFIFPSSLPLPFVFKFSYMKGWLAYLATLAIFGAMMWIPIVFPRNTSDFELSLKWIFAIAAVLSIIGYALSWWLSIRLFKKREL